MEKFLNFSTILFSYVLITLLVISCGGSSGGSGENGGGNAPQAKINEECLLESRPDAETFVAVLCYEGEVLAEIAKAATEPQQINFLIPSTERTEGNTSRTWDISTGAQIQISHVKDYTPTLDSAADGSIKMITATEPDAAAYLFQRLTINSNSFIDTADQLRSIGITFSPVSGSPINAAIAPKLAVKSQDDFISMGKFTAPPLGELYHPLSYVLANDLDLVAPGEEGAKFDDSIIPIADASFDFDGGGHTINLNSEIDAVANDKPAAIIGELKQGNEFKNFTLDVNQPISGAYAVGTILGDTTNNFNGKIHNINININSNLTVYQLSASSVGSVGGLVGSGCFDINNVVVKTADDASIRFAAKDYGVQITANIGGLVGYYLCTSEQSINNSVADVTLGVYAAGDTAPNNRVYIGGLASFVAYSPEIRDNIVNLKIYRDANLPANFAFDQVAGLIRSFVSLQVVTNNLVYVDFSNLGQVKNVGGLFVDVNNTASANNIANNMVFIADGFNTGNVTEKFGAAITNLMDTGSVLNFTDNFFSSPVNDYDTNAKLASFVHTANKDINFNNLILDNKTAAAMFKAGGQAATLQGKVSGANGGPLFTLAEAKTDEISTLFSDGNTSWEAFSGGYPQLKAPSNLIGSLTKAEIEGAWTTTNDLIQTKLATRANQ